MRVGIRELRENLRSYVERVKAGDEVLVTERGTPVARLVAPESHQALRERLIREGTITPAKRPKKPVDVSKLPKMGPPYLSDIVVAMRRGARV